MAEPSSGSNTVNFDVRPWKPSWSCGGGDGNFDDSSGDGRFFDQAEIGGQTPGPGSEESGVKGKNIREESSDPVRSLRSSNDPTSAACGDDEEVTSERKPCARAVRAKKGGCARVDYLISKRRRRERIKVNGKIRTLWELIPNCGSKADKASMLGEAIEYLKILRLHLQMMCLRSRVVCGYRPMVAWAVKYWRVSSGVGGPLISSILPQPQPFQMLGRRPARLITPVPYLPVFGGQLLLPT